MLQRISMRLTNPFLYLARNRFTENSLHLPVLFMSCVLLVRPVSELRSVKLNLFIMSFPRVLRETLSVNSQSYVLGTAVTPQFFGFI